MIAYRRERKSYVSWAEETRETKAERAECRRGGRLEEEGKRQRGVEKTIR